MTRAPIIETAPVGPSHRRFANSAVLGLWQGSPQELLLCCKQIEEDFGRRRSRRWAARVLDLDLIAVEQLEIRARGFILPHYAMAERDFVLTPMAALWPGWRHPRLHLTVRQMLARIRKSKPVRDRSPVSACH